MAPAQFFARFGVFVQPDLLTGEECRQLREEMSAAPSEAAKVGLSGKQIQGPVEGVVASSQRRTSPTHVSFETRSQIVARFLGLPSRCEFFFNVSLAGATEDPKFLIYRPGDFFLPHTDRRRPDDPGAEITKVRRINLILYLNGESATPGPAVYAGGCLTLYGIIDSPAWAGIGFPITGEPGRPVGFRSHLLHEVTPVLHGERYNIVSRFLDADRTAAVLSDKAAGSEY